MNPWRFANFDNEKVTLGAILLRFREFDRVVIGFLYQLQRRVSDGAQATKELRQR
jgi:hypothetical protein